MNVVGFVELIKSMFESDFKMIELNFVRRFFFVFFILIDRSFSFVGRLMFKLPESNLQYVTSITFLLTTYSKYMSAAKHTFNCGNLVVTPATLKNLAKIQVLA